jgi:type II secretory ATPase GspE/PulE/Tfp pilus assembly ATPase PilB-like protein
VSAEEEPAIVKLVYAILLSSIKKRASKIVMRRVGERFVIEFEIAGTMQEELRPPLNLAGPIIERIAGMASLPLARAGETAYGGIHLAFGAGPDSYFAVAVTSSGDSAHANIRAITAAEFEALGRTLHN